MNKLWLFALLILLGSVSADTNITACLNISTSGTWNVTQNLTATTADCIRITGGDVIVNGHGFTIFGSNVTNDAALNFVAGVTRGRVFDLKSVDFTRPILYGGGDNFNVSNYNATSSRCNTGVLVSAGSQNNSLDRVRITCTNTNAALQVSDSANPSINFRVTNSFFSTASTTGTITTAACRLVNNTNMLMENTTCHNTATGIALSLSGALLSGTFRNNTIIANRSNTGILVANEVSNLTFTLNNFSNIATAAVQTGTGVNNWNSTEGNLWIDVVNGSKNITGTSQSAAYPSFCVGNAGSSYPYNSTNSVQLLGNGQDFAPLTPLGTCFANSPPTINGTPTINSSLTTTPTLYIGDTWVGYARADDSGHASITFQWRFYRNGIVISNGTTGLLSSNQTNAIANITGSTIISGNYTFEVRANDTVNVSDWSNSTVLVRPPCFTLDIPGQTYTLNENFNYSTNASYCYHVDSDSGIVFDGQAHIINVTSNASQFWTFGFDNFGGGGAGNNLRNITIYGNIAPSVGTVVYYYGISNSTISDVTIQNPAGIAIQLSYNDFSSIVSKNLTLRNSVITAQTALVLIRTSDNLIYNNKFASTLLGASINSLAGNNTFYWNNFTGAGIYVNDTNGSNFYNSTAAASFSGNTSSLWGNNGELFDAWNNLSDFSYAGYHYGEIPIPTNYTIKNASAYGIIADDGLSDTAALQAAINNNLTSGDVLVFASGIYNFTSWIRLNKSSIALRGQGDTTVFAFNVSMSDLNQSGTIGSACVGTWIYGQCGVIWVGYTSSTGGIGGTQIATVTQNISTRGNRTLTVSNNASFVVGSWKMLVINPDTTAFQKYLYVYPAVPVDNNNRTYRLPMQVESVSGNTVTFRSPLPVAINTSWNVSFYNYTPYQEIGLENFKIQFPNLTMAGHLAEEGYNPMTFYGVLNSWAKNLTCISCDNGLDVNYQSSYNTFDTIIMPDRVAAKRNGDGASYHHGFSFNTNAQFNLVQNLQENAFPMHGVTTNHYSAVNVIRNSTGVALTMDFHEDAPFSNLFTNNSLGGFNISAYPPYDYIPWAQFPYHSSGGTSAAHAAGWNVFWNNYANGSNSYITGITNKLQCPQDYRDLFDSYAIDFPLTILVPAAYDRNDGYCQAQNITNIYPTDLYQAMLNKRLGLLAGQAEGNIYENVQTGAVSITGTSLSSGFPSLYIGAAGSGYPYNHSTSQSKFVCNFNGCGDFAPLTPYQSQQVANNSPNVSSVTVNGTAQLVPTLYIGDTWRINATITDADNSTLSGNVSVYKNGVKILNSTFSGFINNTTATVYNFTNQTQGNYSFEVCAYDGVNWSPCVNSSLLQRLPIHNLIIPGQTYTLNELVDASAGIAFTINAANVTLNGATNSVNGSVIANFTTGFTIKNVTVLEGVLVNNSNLFNAFGMAANSSSGTGLFLERTNHSKINNLSIWNFGANLNGFSLYVFKSLNISIANSSITTLVSSSNGFRLQDSNLVVINQTTSNNPVLAHALAIYNTNNTIVEISNFSCLSSSSCTYIENVGGIPTNLTLIGNKHIGISLGAYGLNIGSATNLIGRNLNLTTSSTRPAAALSIVAGTNILITDSIISGEGTTINTFKCIGTTSGVKLHRNNITSAENVSLNLTSACVGLEMLNNSVISTSKNTTGIVLTSNANFTRNTFANLNLTSTTLLVMGGGNRFALNNFSSANAIFVNDTNGSNFYNVSVEGKNQGNLWQNVLNGTVLITGNETSTIPGYYIGTTGSGYPYNETTSLGKIIGGVDYAPLTSSLTPPAAPIVISSQILNSTNGSLFYTGYTLFGWANVSANGSGLITDLTFKWYKNGTLNSTGTYLNISLSQLVNVANMTGTLKGQNWTLELTANNSAGNSTPLNSSMITISNSIPAQVNLTAPANGTNYNLTFPTTSLIVNLSWNLSTDADNDTLNYYACYGISSPSTCVFTSNLSLSINASGTNTYYWLVIANDGTANSTNSSTRQFTVNLGSNSAPLITAISVTPSTPTITSTLQGHVTVSDAESSTALIYFEWYKNGTNQTALAGNYTIPVGVSTIVSNISAGNLSNSDVWFIRARAYDGNNYSSFNNSSSVTITSQFYSLVNVSISPVPVLITGSANCQIYPYFANSSAVVEWKFYVDFILEDSGSTVITDTNTTTTVATLTNSSYTFGSVLTCKARILDQNGEGVWMDSTSVVVQAAASTLTILPLNAAMLILWEQWKTLIVGIFVLGVSYVIFGAIDKTLFSAALLAFVGALVLNEFSLGLFAIMYLAGGLIAKYSLNGQG